MLPLWRLELLIEDCFNGLKACYRSARNRVPGSNLMPTLSLAATIGSTAAAFLAWDAARNANQVAAASQALALKVYNDQVALGHPSISVLSGESTISLEPGRGYRAEGVHDYVASIILRNSGQRDSPRVWVALYVDGFISTPTRATLATLPSGLDVSVRIPLGSPFGVDGEEHSWIVAILYQDELPFAGVNTSTELSPSQQLRLVCTPPVIFQGTSWPKEHGLDPAIRVFSSGSPVAIEQQPSMVGGDSNARKAWEARKEVIRAAQVTKACMEVTN